MAIVFAIRHSPGVRGRTSKLVLGAGFVVVMVGLVDLMYSATQGASPLPIRVRANAATPTPLPEAPPAEPVASPPPPKVATPARPAAASSARFARPERAPQLAPEAFSFKREMKRDENGKLVPIISAQELRELWGATEAPMRACLERSGKGVSGKATLNFTVEAKDGKLFIETTGVQDEDTLSGYPDLLDCMHKTATAVSLEGRKIPELGTPIYVRRHVRVEGGALAENTVFNFSYNP